MRRRTNGVPGGGEFLRLPVAAAASTAQPPVELLPSLVVPLLPLELLLSASIGTHSPISLWCEPWEHSNPSRQ
jgi:hypothetical protein